jgi:hypothetical protein
MSLVYSIGDMNYLADALEKAGFTPEDITKLRQFKVLGKIRDVLSEKAVIIYSENVIDCDESPFTPENWKVEEHKKGGQLKFDPAKFFLYLSKKQEEGRIVGDDLRKELANRSLNANVLDYLLAHSWLIPEEWKGKYIFFWGTIYRDSDSRLYVRYLCWYGGSEWSWGHKWLFLDFNSDDPAILAS